ncbi:hypothetical protein Acy02nite_34550 [Actinoplanes cyaneus]|uniref:Peptidase C14 caspase domain-containing protein n=1 Tax=Actinoplanes cyaneus TaxID=52696 RepID=A0A919IGT2_9ACTN|nr:caspase family protein [Actinoplanes cyaneus]MCW2140258.1 Caspase domain-containing protein [Actinoplanes cyaneus]GID65574.1 hypothetical protein Acy02nite_34550 [Actinoplanes cyaneus]
MSTVYALLVGVDRYAAPDLEVPDLRGCVNDVTDVLAMLTTTLEPGVKLEPLVLLDGEATLAAVIAGLRTHLGQAGPEDTALFWFSGHGSQAPAPPGAWVVEGTGMVQTLVCHDSRAGGVPDLWDKELSGLLDVIAAGARHVAVVLDSCHSEGGTREVGSRWRAVPPGPARDVGSLLPETPPPTGPAPDGPEHVALAACRRDQRAEERLLEGVPRGLFTWSLLRALKRLGPAATYASLLAAARSEVAQHRAFEQSPQLYPAASALADEVFLLGEAGTTGTGVVLSYGLHGWQIDMGRAHGLPAEPAGLSFAVRGDGRRVRVGEVRPELSLVEPLNWVPDRDRQYAMVVATLPRPRATVAGFEVPESPYLRNAREDEPVALTVRTGPGGARITDHQGRGTDVAGTPEQILAALEHLARWLWLRDQLRNPDSRLGEPIRLEVVPAGPGDVVEVTDGAVRVDYAWTGSGWTAPEVYIHLYNTSNRLLYVTVLDLTPRFAAHARLYPPAPIAAGHRTAAREGRRLRISLPAGEQPRPGLEVSEWLLVVASERPFGAEPYLLPPLAGFVHPVRDVDDADPPAGDGTDWTVQRFEIRTRVPRLT